MTYIPSPQTIPVEQDQLASWTRYANNMGAQALILRSALAGRHADDIREMLMVLHLMSASAVTSLQAVGAKRPDDMEEPDVPLHLLSTPSSRRLAALLREVVEVAADVNRERGYSSAAVQSQLQALAAAVHLEVYGPEGKGEGPDL